MNRNYSHRLAAAVMVLAFLMSACAGGIIASTPTPLPTSTPRPTITARPTSTPRPTATAVPPTPTAAPMGVTVSSGAYEVDVVSMRTLRTVYLDKIYHWAPTAGNMFVELGIKAVNLQAGTQRSMAWGDLYVMEEDGSVWFPTWGEFKPVASGVEVSPKSLVFRLLENAPGRVTFDEVVFVRAIYAVPKHSPTTLLFGFGEAPLIEVIVP